MRVQAGQEGQEVLVLPERVAAVEAAAVQAEAKAAAAAALEY
jgi:hypothetical protein